MKSFLSILVMSVFCFSISICYAQPLFSTQKPSQTQTTAQPETQLKTPSQTQKAPQSAEPLTPATKIKEGMKLETKIPNKASMVKPDLVVSEIKLYVPNPAPKEKNNLLITVKNNGVSASTPTQAAVTTGGETNPTLHNIPALQPMATHQLVQSVMKDNPGNYLAKVTLDINNTVAESNEDNNRSELTYTVKDKPFIISDQSMLTYTFPNSHYFTIYLRPSENVDPTTVNDSVVVARLLRYENGVKVTDEPLPGRITRQLFIEWRSDESQWAASCSGECVVDVTLKGTIKSERGVLLDGDRNGQPGGDYHHQFTR
jgi:hypothetical protein